MSEALIIQLVRETLWLSLQLFAPILLVTLVVGLIISIFQARISSTTHGATANSPVLRISAEIKFT